jgi:hypothetical protein
MCSRYVLRTRMYLLASAHITRYARMGAKCLHTALHPEPRYGIMLV